MINVVVCVYMLRPPTFVRDVTVVISSFVSELQVPEQVEQMIEKKRERDEDDCLSSVESTSRHV